METPVEHPETAPEVLEDDVEQAQSGEPDEQFSERDSGGGWLDWLRRRSGVRYKRALDAISDLDDAILRHPEAPTNYVLRGEIYLRIGYNHLAIDDFEAAIALAAEEFEARRWGVIAQTMQDRARRSLQIARRRAARLETGQGDQPDNS